MPKKIVYVLGAGSSVDAGGPLMKDFFSRSHKDDEKIYSRYFDGKDRFNRVIIEFKKWRRDNPRGTVEEFFDYVANASFLGEVSGRLERDLIWYLGSYVVRRFDWRRIPSHYWEFANLLKRRGFRSVLVTFNYDILFERLLIKTYGELDYCLGRFKNVYVEDWTDHTDSGIKLLKLHGSVNWALCEDCDALYLLAKPVVQKLRRGTCQRRDHGILDPFLVPPSWNKNEYLQSIDLLWRRARNELRDADIVAIVGYSFPDADQFARTLISLANGPNVKLIIANRNARVGRKIRDSLHRTELITSGLSFREFVQQLPSILRNM